MGMKNKLSLGSWINPGFRTLHRMRKIRGTKLDVFGYHHIRKMERELITEYRETIEQLLHLLNPHSLTAAVEIAERPTSSVGTNRSRSPTWSRTTRNWTSSSRRTR